jgi:hypothetical protein
MPTLPVNPFDPNTAQVQNPDQVKPVYSNNAACMMSAHDIRIVFHEVVMNGAAEVPHLELRANVIMAPTQLKALSVAVTETLKKYEQNFGTIKWPPQPPKTN